MRDECLVNKVLMRSVVSPPAGRGWGGSVQRDVDPPLPLPAGGENIRTLFIW